MPFLKSKIRFVILSSFVLLGFLVQAQHNGFKNEVYIGVNAGMNGSMVYFKPDVPQGYLVGRQGGLVFRYINEKNVGLQAEINYSERGWSEINNSFDKRLNYIEVPFLTHLYFGNNVRFFFNLGPKFSYLISEKTLLNTNPSSTQEQHIQDVQNKFDYGLAAGIGCMFKIKKQVFQLESRGNISANNIFSNNIKDYFDNSHLIHASITIGWLMSLNNK
ncbi:MAG: hypothetical protein BGO29_05855 [Bacteroidales bacterium 36-12]|nr:MAG: hypothetical protein BGO29_05855 [Bacteroidales bacterium 36-12]